LRSPIAGTILERKVALGQNVDPEAPLFRVADLSVLWLTIQAFERGRPPAEAGIGRRGDVPALPGRTISGKVTWVGSQVDVTSRTIPVRVTVENSDGLLRPGMSASAWLPVGEAGAAVLAVPVAALQRLDEKWVVFVPRKAVAQLRDPPGRAGRDLGRRRRDSFRLQGGDTVVVDGAFLLKAEAEKAKGMGEQHEH
jgi:cobalt-zinc-cadmium efflux system membrane fusion protein